MSNNCETYIKVRRRECRLEIYRLNTADDSFCSQLLDVALDNSLQIIRQTDDQILFLFPFNTNYTLTYTDTAVIADVVLGIEIIAPLTFDQLVDQLISWRTECSATTAGGTINGAPSIDLEPICYDDAGTIREGWLYAVIPVGATIPTFSYLDSGLTAIATPTIVECPDSASVPQYEFQEVGCYNDGGVTYTKVIVLDEENLTNPTPTVLFLGDDGGVLTVLSGAETECEDTTCEPASSGVEITSANLAVPFVVTTGFLANTFSVLNLSSCAIRVTYTATGVNGTRTHYVAGRSNFSLPELSCATISDIQVEYPTTCTEVLDPAVVVDVIKVK